ncbi:MAG TPA: hypothetical protein VLL76_03645 [Candidatus Omnitrophota bacterium]|nr:hypothetical protein [Candidatus Omnitrophota bacterium]
MADLFPDAPRRPRRVLMHVMDAGSGMIEFACRRCGHNTGWIRDDRTVTENRRGRPCPKCNASPKQASEE